MFINNMKNLKTLLEVKDINNSTNSNKTNNLSVTLNIASISNILFALAYTYKHDNEANKWKRAEYESLYFSLYKEAVKVFDKNELEDLGIKDNIEKVQTKY